MTIILPEAPHSAPTAAPADVLLATWDGGGHAAPMLSIARALLARGHRVRVLADPVLGTEVEASGATFVPWRTAPHRTSTEDAVITRDWEADSPAAAAARLRDNLMCGPARAFAADTLRELSVRPADVVAADHLLLGALIAGEAVGARTAAIATTLLGVPGWGVPPAGTGLAPARGPLGRTREALLNRVVIRLYAKGLPAVNAAREAHGLGLFEHPAEMITAWDRVLVLSSKAIELPSFAPPAHVRLVGARLDDPAWVAPWQPPAGTDPLVLVAMSSSHMEQRDALARAAAALGRLPLRGVLTTGPAVDPAAVPAPRNVQVVRSAPHARVLRHASAVVTHAGHGTVAKTLAAGVPLVALPLGRDQPDVAVRVAQAGAGLTLPKSSSPERIAAAVRRVLEEPAFAAAARRVAGVMADERRTDLAVTELEELVGVRA
jgi:UDP:flavonoid glycosyltransferase YjiC (YdhE family)